MDKAKAQELVAKLERHQYEQIQCLRALCGLVHYGESMGKIGVPDEVQGLYTWSMLLLFPG